MNHVACLRNLALVAITVTGPVAVAAPAHNVCVPNATGVPTRSGPPKWLGWGGTQPVDVALDDPRWLGAAGHSFELGSARAPLQSRALWANEGGTTYLYLSFIVDLEGFATGTAATPRDLFLGFRRPSAFAGTGGSEVAYMFQFHLDSTAAATPTTLVVPEHCAAANTCDENSGTPKNFWRLFVDRGAAAETCASDASVVGQKFEKFLDGSGGAPITWMTSATPATDSVRYWKLDATQPPLLQNRWAVQLRLKIAPTDTGSLETGIPPSATFWYQGSMALPGGGSVYAATGWWPRELTTTVCPQSGLQDSFIHAELGTSDNWSRISRYSGTTLPSDCDKGITIRHQNIGAVFDAAPGTVFASVSPTTSFKATRPDGTIAANTVIAQPVNLGPTDVMAPLMARFRLASWGSAPYTPGDLGKWKDMRGAENGICAQGSLPACTPAYRIPGLIDADGDGLPDPGTNNRGAITFQWTIGNDPTIGASEYCKFGLVPPTAGATCGVCSCASAPNCDVSSDPGTQATVGATTFPCVSKNYQHQCMLVELIAPNGGINFVQQSSWNNMNFDQMSVVEREALIDPRQLPVGKGQKEQDIYFVVMARNMPKQLPGAQQNGGAYISERALVRAESKAAPYLKDMGQLSPNELGEIIVKYHRQFETITPHNQKQLERFKQVQKALLIMPEPDFRLTYGLLKIAASTGKPDLVTEAAVREIGPAEAAGIVPTLDIYPFYQPEGHGVVYMPMSAFSVFLSHDGGMSGMTWAIDGATQVGQNVYRLKIPVGRAKKIQVRAQAVESNGNLLAPGNPMWPCTGGGGCCPGASKNCGLVPQMSNALPGMLAALFAVLRGRRRRRRPTLTTLP